VPWHWHYVSLFRTTTKHGRHVQGLTLQKWLTFGGDPVQDSPGSLFNFLPLWNRTVISISHTVTGRFLRWLTPTKEWIHNTLGPIRQTSESGLIRKYGFESRITFCAWRSLRARVVTVLITCEIFFLQMLVIQRNARWRANSVFHETGRITRMYRTCNKIISVYFGRLLTACIRRSVCTWYNAPARAN